MAPRRLTHVHDFSSHPIGTIRRVRPHVQTVGYSLRIVNNTPKVLRGALPGGPNAVALEVPPQSSVESFAIPAETAAHLLARGATAVREGTTLVFDLVIDVTP